MAKKKVFGIPRLLSDGIGETINTANNHVGQLRYEIVALSRIDLDQENPRDLLINKSDVINGISPSDPEFARKTAEIESLSTMAFSIKKAGVRNPVELYRDNGRYVLISGERRVLSSLLAGKTDVPAKILDTKPDEMQLRFLQWIENIEREDLSIWERIDNIAQLINAYSALNPAISMNADVLSEIIGCSKKQSKRYLDVMTLPDDMKVILKKSGIADLIKLALIATIKDKEAQLQFIDAASKGLSRQDLSALIHESTHHNRKPHVISRKNTRGRPRTSIALHISMDKVPAVRLLFEKILHSESEYAKHRPRFHRVDWSDANQIKGAFQSLLALLDSKPDCVGV